MAENKTRPTAASVEAFLAAVPDPQRRSDAERLRAMLERVSGEPAAMWGPSIVGFGRYSYRYDSGREGEAPLIGFSPRAKELVVYLADGFERRRALLDRLGKHRAGKSCLYLKRLADVDESVLEALAAESLAHLREAWPEG